MRAIGQLSWVSVISLLCAACALNGYDPVHDRDGAVDPKGDGAGNELDGGDDAGCVAGELGCLCTTDTDCEGAPTCQGGRCAPADGSVDCVGAAAYHDDCGVCDDDAAKDNSTCTQDCSGAWDGGAYVDPCGVCDDVPANDCACTPGALACTAYGDVGYCTADGMSVDDPTQCIDTDLVCRDGRPVALCEGVPGDPGCACDVGSCVAGYTCEQTLCMPLALAHWPLDGNDLDVSGNGYHGTSTGVVFGANESTFDGAYSRIDVAGLGDDLYATIDTFTLHMRVRPAAYGNLFAVFFMLGALDESFAGNSMRFQEQDGNLSIKTETGDGVDHIVTLGPAPPIGVWTSLTFVINANWVTLYRDGGCAERVPFVPVETGARNVAIGGWADGGHDFAVNGDIGEVRIYSEPLGRREISALAAP